MKKFFFLLAAVLMAGSMMAENPNLIKFTEPAAAGSLNDVTFGSEFTLTITDTGNKVSVDANNATFGVSDEETISFNHRLKTGGKSSSANKMTLIVPEEGMLVVYARPASPSATDRYFVIANGSDTIVKHICLDTDTVEGASSKIFLPVIVENVPAGTYELTYNAAVNFYGFDMPAEETENTHESVLLYEMITEEAQGSNNSYAGNCDIEMGGIVWNFTGNSQMNPWRIGGKSLDAVEREVYTKTAYPAELDSICLYLGNNTLTSLDGFKLVYSTNANFSDAEEVIAAVPEAFPATVTFAVEGGFPAKAYYKFVFTCTVSGSSNKYIQFHGVDFWGVKPDAPAVEAPEFDLAAGSYYDEQTLHLTCETEGAAILYTADGTDPVLGSASVYMAQYGIYLPAGTTTTIKAIAYNNDSDNPQFSEVVSKTYTIAPVYNSFDELVNQAGAPANQKVVVNFENVVIDSLYVSSKGKVNGVYLTAAGRMVEIYCYDVPAEWEVGGTISGTVKGEWKEYLGTWEVCPDSWDGITYAATLTFEVEAGTTTFTVTPSDLEVEYYISVIPSVDEDDVPYTKEGLVALIDGIIDDMGAGLEYFSGVQTQSYEEDWYVDEPGDYLIVVCGINAGHSARTSDVIITPFTFGSTTGVENVEAVKATKAIEDGQLIIIRNGVRYNAAGMRF